MVKLEQLLREAVEAKASDIHLTAGLAPIFRIEGNLVLTEHPRLESEDSKIILGMLATTAQLARFQRAGELDFSYSIPGLSRFRINVFRQRGSISVAIRLVPEQVPSLAQLGLPEVIGLLARKARGLVLITGATGSGKSTTLAAMIDLINTERSCHIITIEDPIEYLHSHKKSIISQREVYTDTQSFPNALRASLREDPDVILVGEMRDTETIATAITAAETGHLVLATLHTGDAAQAIDRIIDVFPSHQQQQVRAQLSLTLQGVVAQQLLRRRDGSGRIAALEILIGNLAVRNLIREGKTHQLLSVIQSNGTVGMQSMDTALRNLYRQGIVTYEEALSKAADIDNFICLTSK